MRVALTHPYSWPEVRRGAERVLAETALSLGKRGHQVTVLTSGPTPSKTTCGPVQTIRFRRIFRDAIRHERWFGRRIMPSLARGNFDIVQTMMPHDAVGALRVRSRAGFRLVYEEIGIPWRSWWSQLRDGRQRVRVVAEADVYGCMSAFALDALLADWAREGALIPGGVRLADFSPAARREPDPTILFSGALVEPRKGLAELLTAAALLLPGQPNLKIWLSGPGNPSSILSRSPPDVRAVVELLPLGSPQEQGDRYSRAWVTALPSKSDCFGLVLVESLAAGTPIVVLDDAAPPELVVEGNGAISPSLDPQDLACALRQGLDLATDPDTAQICRESARPYDWDEGIAPLLERIYQQP